MVDSSQNITSNKIQKKSNKWYEARDRKPTKNQDKQESRLGTGHFSRVLRYNPYL